MQGITVRVDEGTLPVEATTDQAGFYTLTKSPGHILFMFLQV